MSVKNFKHVCQRFPPEEIQRKRAIFMVQFDGEWEYWYSQKIDPGHQDVEDCVTELNTYYRTDWRGTKRILPVITAMMTDYGSINCL